MVGFEAQGPWAPLERAINGPFSLDGGDLEQMTWSSQLGRSQARTIQERLATVVHNFRLELLRITLEEMTLNIQS